MYAGQAPHYAWGIPFQDRRSADYARTVMRIASLMTLVALVSAILQLATGYYFSIGIFAAVILPLCGYFGALKRSRFMLSCFSVCNVIIATLFMISFILTISIVGDYVSCACNAACRDEHAIPPDEAARVCGDQSKYRALYWTSMGFGFTMVALQCAGAYYSSKLLRAPHMVVTGIPVAQPVVGTYVAPQQPGSYLPPGATAPSYTMATPPPYAPAYHPQQHHQSRAA